jgi:hypothetical protein
MGKKKRRRNVTFDDVDVAFNSGSHDAVCRNAGVVQHNSVAEGVQHNSVVQGGSRSLDNNKVNKRGKGTSNRCQQCPLTEPFSCFLF